MTAPAPELTAAIERAFRLDAALGVFEKADAEVGKRRRIFGVVSTESAKDDRQTETVIQEGLDFGPFFKFGWFNDNHSKETDGIVGIPDAEPRFFRKGQKLPNGETATENCHWAEGYLLEKDERAAKIWNKAKALEGTGRTLGFSIEGTVKRRTGPDNKTIARAVVNNVAITAVPVNVGTELQTQLVSLAKSLTEVGAETAKALDVGTQDAPGSGRVLARESVEGVTHDATDAALARRKRRKRKDQISKAEAVAYVLRRYPRIDCQTAGRIVDLAIRRKEIRA